MTKSAHDKQCKAYTIKNTRCPSSAKEGSEFCGRHKYFRFRKIPFYQNPFLQLGTILGIVSLGATIYFGVLGPKREDINQIKKEMEAYNNVNASSLEAKYPKGYILFAIHNNQITKWEPENSKLKIDFNTAKILKVDKNRIHLSVPLIDLELYKYKINEKAFLRLTFVYTIFKTQWLYFEGSVIDSKGNGIPNVLVCNEIEEERNYDNGGVLFVTYWADSEHRELPKDWRFCFKAMNVIVSRNEGSKIGCSFYGQDNETWTEVLVSTRNHIICVYGIKENTYTHLNETSGD